MSIDSLLSLPLKCVHHVQHWIVQLVVRLGRVVAKHIRRHDDIDYTIVNGFRLLFT
jgi:hypothetical protein